MEGGIVGAKKATKWNRANTPLASGQQHMSCQEPLYLQLNHIPSTE